LADRDKEKAQEGKQGSGQAVGRWEARLCLQEWRKPEVPSGRGLRQTTGFSNAVLQHSENQVVSEPWPEQSQAMTMRASARPRICISSKFLWSQCW
jgi:hypothetical protein